MHNLVKEATGIDFHELSNDLQVAKEVTLGTLGNLDNKEKSSIEACPSLGHVLNEVNLPYTQIKSAFLCNFLIILSSGAICVKKDQKLKLPIIWMVA